MLLLGAASVLGWHWYQERATHYDVVVVGAGPGGIAASIQASRMGARVALLEPTDWVGGQITAAGVGTMDEGNVSVRRYGLYNDFVNRVTSYYAQRHKSVSTCYYDTGSLCVDPQVGRTILGQMLDEQPKHLKVFTGQQVTSVLKKGNTVTGVMAAGKRYSANVVIDADEYGDVLAQAGAPFRLGNGTSASPSAKGCIQDITYTAVVRSYPGGPPSGLRFTQPPPGYTKAIALHFAAFLKQHGFQTVRTHPKDPFLVHKDPQSFPSYAAYRGVPDLANPKNYSVLQENGRTISRTSLDLGNDYPLKGTLSTAYISDPIYRQKTTCEAKLETLQLLYYIQHDIGETNWSIANDEGYATLYNQQHRCPQLKGYEAFEDNMPVEPYVREGRRLIGTETLTGNQLVYSWKDRSHTPQYGNSIAVGYYPMDLHECYQPATLEAAFDSPDDRRATYSGGPFEVPLGVLIPQHMDGLLAAEKNISASRLANGAIREQPIAMDIGQAAGALAALAAKDHVQPRQIAAGQVQAVLKSANAAITLPQRSTHKVSSVKN